MFMPGDRHPGADAVDVEQLRVEHEDGAAGHVGPASAEYQPAGWTERDQRAPALRLGGIRLVAHQPVRLAAAEDVADDPGDSLFARWTPVGSTPAPLRRLVRRPDELVTAAQCILFELLDDNVGDHRRETVTTVEIQPEVVEQRDWVRRELPASGSDEQLARAGGRAGAA